MNPILANKRIMVVEDELLVAMLIEDVLADEECRIVGPFMTLSDALAAARIEVIDIALLDVNLHGQKVYPVAEVLAIRNIPFLFLTGYGRDAIPDDHPDWRVCSKPFRPNDLTEILAEIVREHQDFTTKPRTP